MTSDWKSTKIKVVDLDENNNFVVDEFFIRNHLRSQKSGWSFEIQICQTTSDGKTTKIKVVDLD